MRNQKYWIGLLALTAMVSSTPLHAKSGTGGVGLTLEPLAGTEQFPSAFSAQNSVSRFVYGGRVTVGLLLFSAEGEYLHATGNGASDSYKIGLRSAYGMGAIKFVLRAGAQGEQGYENGAPNGVPQQIASPMTFKPYGGAELRLGLSRRFALVGDAVCVATSFSNLNQNEYQFTGGFALQF